MGTESANAGSLRHHRVDVGEVHLHCVTVGEGPTVVLLHGFPETWTCWRHVIPGLVAAGYRVVAPDLRGYGGSDKPAAARAYRGKHLVADVVGLIDHFGGPVHLVGHDWGAIVAWYAAMRVPERLRTLSILQVPHPLRYRYDLWTAPTLLRRIDLPTLVLWGDRDRHLAREGADPPPRWVTDVRVEHLPEASHWLPEEAPERVTEHLLAHFARR